MDMQILFFVLFRVVFRLVRPSAEQRQNRQDYTAQDVAQNANQKIHDRLERETDKVEIQGVCNRVVKTAESKHDNREHNADGGGQTFSGGIFYCADRKGNQETAKDGRRQRFYVPKVCV